MKIVIFIIVGNDENIKVYVLLVLTFKTLLLLEDNSFYYLINFYVYVHRYSTDAVTKARETKEGLTEDGIEDAFDLVGEVN